MNSRGSFQWVCSCGAKGYKRFRTERLAEKAGSMHAEREGAGHTVSSVQTNQPPSRRGSRRTVALPTPAPVPEVQPEVHPQASVPSMTPEQVMAYLLAGHTVHTLPEPWAVYRNAKALVLVRVDNDDSEPMADALSRIMVDLARLEARRLRIKRALEEPDALALRTIFGGTPA